ncbi:MAG: hydroxymethylbilane synthase [Dehalococcoidia bacterium]|nr:porphobilinogen deaminase [Dehalococcoidia bacterium]MBF8303731.1 porphobilinogen deaminase [Dehalococcoidia bacterium]MDO8636035.1 hydroxymethylbilane synthase [Dehalococcoidia bacterium]
MESSRPVIVGSRGSPLAMAQTQDVIRQLNGKYPEVQFNIKKITTQGDVITNKPLPKLGGKGLFVKELEVALINSEIDFAVHSFKDLPTELTPGLIVGAITKRVDPRDALVSKNGETLDDLPPGSTVGTSSPRRASQILAYRPDLEIVDLRGNLDTRLRKVNTGEVDAAVLAAAGLIRLGLADKITQLLSPEICLPAVGQGALAIEVRQDNLEIADMVKVLNHEATNQAICAERACLVHLGGGCNVPIGVYGRVKEGTIILQGIVACPDGNHVVRSGINGDVNMCEGLGHLLGRRLLALGADKILAGELA